MRDLSIPRQSAPCIGAALKVVPALFCVPEVVFHVSGSKQQSHQYQPEDNAYNQAESREEDLRKAIRRLLYEGNTASLERANEI